MYIRKHYNYSTINSVSEDMSLMNEYKVQNEGSISLSPLQDLSISMLNTNYIIVLTIIINFYSTTRG